MLSCPGATRALMLNTDIFHIIVDQLATDNARDSLQSMSLTSKLLGRICRAYLFKRVKVDIHDQEGVAFFKSVLDRDPQVAWFVRYLSITDNTPPSPIPTFTEEQRIEDRPMLPSNGDRYAEVTDERSTLAMVLSQLRNLNGIAIMFQYVFAGQNQHPLRWNELSSAVRLLFQHSDLLMVKLEGIRCIPMSLSKTFLSIEDLHLLQCTFTQSLANTDQHNQPRVKSTRTVMKRLSFEWLGMGEDMDPNVEGTTILGHWVYLNWMDHAQLPEIEQLSLSLGCWASIAEAGLFLNVFQHTIRSLSLNTTGLHLEPLRLLPLYKSALDRTMRPLTSLHAKSILLLMSQGVTTLADGWAAYDLQSISLRHPSNPTVHSLELTSAYWDTTSYHSQNGEMAWICHMLADLPEERARMISTLSIRIKIGTHFLLQDAAVALLTRFAEDEMWCILNDTLSKDKWCGLRSLSITASVPSIFVNSKMITFSNLVLDHVYDNCLYDLTRRGILYLGFENETRLY